MYFLIFAWSYVHMKGDMNTFIPFSAGATYHQSWNNNHKNDTKKKNTSSSAAIRELYLTGLSANSLGCKYLEHLGPDKILT